MSMIPDEIIEQVRDAADLVSIIGEKVDLKRTGADYRGACPFHGGQHRNFAVIPKKGSFYCFVCKAAGDIFQVTVGPEEGYGLRDEQRIQRVPKKYFKDGDRLKPGMVTVLQSQQGPQQVTVVKVGATVVDIDANHPLAGKTLSFDIEITGVREANPEELAHGHVHGPGGHHH